MSHEVGVPRLPEPPPNWTADYMREFIRVLGHWMSRMTTETVEELGYTTFTTVTANASVGVPDGVILVDTTGGNITVTVPDAATVKGAEIVIKRTTAGANTLTVATGGGNIDGTATISINVQYRAIRIKSDGANYWVIAGYTTGWGA